MILFRDTLSSSQVNFKVHIALFNFQSAFQTVAFDGSLIYHSFSHLSSWIFKIFKTFLKFWFSFNFHFLRSSAPQKCRFHNISHFKQFFKSTLKDFSKFFISLAGSTEALSSSITDDFLIYTAFWTIASRILKNFGKKLIFGVFARKCRDGI